MEDLINMHWTTLKKLVEAKGAVYTDKKAAIALLKGDVLPAPDEFALAPATELIMLNRDLPYGVILGELAECPVARFTQEGHLFDGQGRKVG